MPDRDTRKPGWAGIAPRRPRQLGYRGSMLLALGVCWVILGVGVLDSTSSINPSLLHERIPHEVRGWAWIITGLVAIAYAWRPTGIHDAPGYLALYLMPAIRVVSYGLAWLDHLLPIGGTGYALGWRFAAIYLAMLAAVIISAGHPETPHTRHLTRRTKGVA